MVKFVNLHYIKAAIKERTGLTLTLREVAQYLVSEGLITDAKAKQALNFSYNIYHPVSQSDKPLDNPLPIDVMVERWSDVNEDEVVDHEDD